MVEELSALDGMFHLTTSVIHLGIKLFPVRTQQREPPVHGRTPAGDRDREEPAVVGMFSKQLCSQASWTAHQHSFQLQGDKRQGSGSEGARLTHKDKFQQSPVDRMRIGRVPDLSLLIRILQVPARTDL